MTQGSGVTLSVSLGLRCGVEVQAIVLLRRGLRDTKTPLWGTAASTVVNYGLHILFMGTYGWGVQGAGWAVVIGQWVGSVLLVGRLGTVGAIHWPDMLKLPSGHELTVTLKVRHVLHDSLFCGALS